MNKIIQTYSREELAQMAWECQIECAKIEMRFADELLRIKPSMQEWNARHPADDENPEEEV